MIKAVLFDVAGVLTQGYTQHVVASALETGADLEALGTALLPVFAGDEDTDSPGHQLERGQVTLDDFLASLGPLEEHARLVLHPSSSHFFGHQLAPEPAMQAFAAELHEAGYLTGIVSNTVREWHETWDRALTSTDHFETVVFSANVGIRKPNAAIYHLATERLGVAADEALFLDDFAPMVDGARRAGLQGVHVEDHQTAIADVRSILGL